MSHIAKPRCKQTLERNVLTTHGAYRHWEQCRKRAVADGLCRECAGRTEK